MAKRSRTASRGAIVVRSAPSPRPIVVTAGARAPARRRSRRTRVGSAAGGTQLFSRGRTGAMIGAYVLGVLDKQGAKIPTIPLLGRAGSAGLAMYYAGKALNMPSVVEASTGALAVAAYELAKDGTIAGEDFASV